MGLRLAGSASSARGSQGCSGCRWDVQLVGGVGKKTEDHTRFSWARPGRVHSTSACTPLTRTSSPGPTWEHWEFESLAGQPCPTDNSALRKGCRCLLDSWCLSCTASAHCLTLEVLSRSESLGTLYLAGTFQSALYEPTHFVLGETFVRIVPIKSSILQMWKLRHSEV